MKKLLIVEIVNRTLLLVLCLSMIVALIALSGSAWFMHNPRLDIHSSPIYAVNQGHSGNLSIDVLQRIYQSDTTMTVVMVPGDLVTYSFIFQVPLNELTSEQDGLTVYQTDYSVELNLNADAYEGATSGKNGEYLSFLDNCIIQEDACSVSVMQRFTENGETSYLSASYTYDAINGRYRRSVEGDTGVITKFDHTTEGVVVSNDEVVGFAPDGSVSVKFNITFPILDPEVYPTSKDGDTDYVFFMLNIPVWYYDTGWDNAAGWYSETAGNQNNEMYSVLNINGCTILPIK